MYFRAGKQVLKWGTGYFWNPTDLINIEHRSFTNTNALLHGVFGLRSDVVFSPNWHLYTFLNLNGVQDRTHPTWRLPPAPSSSSAPRSSRSPRG